MALDPANSVTYYLRVAAAHRDYLGAIRHWNNLKIAAEEGFIWVKDLTEKQVDSVDVKSIPYKELYYAVDQQLFLLGSLLPSRAVPSRLWTPIERGLPVQLPAFNHNYFGVHDKIAVTLVPSYQEREACALLATLEVLKAYVETAPVIRLKNLQWALVDDDKAIIMGTPLLPLQGEVFWCSGDFLLPGGWALELYALADAINRQINPERNCWIGWSKEGAYWRLDKNLLSPLSIGSFRKSLKQWYGLA